MNQMQTPPDEATVQRVRKVVLGYSGLGDSATALTDTTDLWKAGMDSLAGMRLVVAVESEFQIELPDELLTRETLRSIAEISTAVSRVQRANQSPGPG